MAHAQGDYSSARSLYEQSLAIRRELGDKRGIARSLLNLGLVAYCQGDYSSARSLLEQSLAIQRELGDKRGIALSLLNLGAVSLKEGDLAAARAYLTESFILSLEMGDKPLIAYALEESAKLAHTEQTSERAALLFGAAGALSEAIGAPLSPADREEIDRALAELRATLGEDAFDSAWAAGQAMTWEQATEYALGGSPAE